MKSAFWGLFFLIPLHIFSQDTLDYQLSPTEISAQLDAALRNSADKTIFSPDSMGLYDAVGTSADAILRQAEGLYIRNYGGHGGVKTVSIRGFSTQQTTASLNGVPYQNPQSGVVNFGTFYPQGYDGIEVTRSASGANTNPLGGNVNFSIHPKKTGARLQLSAGSFGEQIVGLSTSYVKKKTAIQVGLQQTQAEDNFLFDLNGESGTRSHASFFSRQYQVYMSQGLGSSWKIDYLLTGYFNNQEVPGPVTKGNAVNDEGEIETEDQFYYMRLAREFVPKTGFGLHQTSFVASYHYNYLDYTVRADPQLYTSRDLWFQGEATFLGKQQKLSVLGQYRSSWLSGNNLAIRFTPVTAVRREEINVGASHEGYLAIGKASLVSKVVIRANYLKAYNVLPNASLSLTYKSASQHWEVFSNGHFGYRIPTFNELYYFGFGNADLEPEQVRSLEVGQWWKLNPGIPFVVKTTFFTNRTRNKIISIPINPARWSTLSIGKTGTAGMEVAAEASVKKILKLNVAYTLQKAVDLTRSEKPYLPYTPPDIWSYGGKLTFHKFSLLVNAHYSGWRYSLLQNGPLSYLAPYHVVDASMTYTGTLRKFTYRFSVEGENLLGSRYEVIRSYPMPPEAFRVGILISY